MRVRLFVLAGLSAILLVSCAGPSPAPAATAVPSLSVSPVPHAPGIHFALVGDVTDVNVWALFDVRGYSYNNYALRNEYWPRLFRLSIPDRQFEPMAAGAMPSPVQEQGNFYTATVPLRTDLLWTDGSPFTAEDVAFTVNTVLSFQPGFDWHDFYNPDYIDHAQALDDHTVKYFFKKQPNVGVWQYGALQGPVVQKAYWVSKVAAPAALLPSRELILQIETLKAGAANLQQKPDDRNHTLNELNKAQSEFDAAISAAREALFALDNRNEPTLGNWTPAGQQNGVWTNKVNPAHPFGQPHFESASYTLFADEESAAKAFQNKDVDMVLTQGGIILPPTGPYTGQTNVDNRFVALAFNQSNPVLTVPALRQVLACMIWISSRSNSFSADSFILNGLDFWRDPGVQIPCAELKANDMASRLNLSVQTLKAAGYSWNIQPAWDPAASAAKPGIDLRLPNGDPFPPIVVLSPTRDIDAEKAGSADFIVRQAAILGMPLTVQYTNPEDIRYAVFGSGRFDMAVLGWRVSEYPGYLCDWFGDGNPFHYDGGRLKPACEALTSTSDLGSARKQIDQIQSVLAQDLPFIPLYSTAVNDYYRGISYPFSKVVGGLSEIYGAPSLAIPASQ